MSLSEVLNDESGKGFRIFRKKCALPIYRATDCGLAGWERKETAMPKPPRSSPHSDLDGVHRDRRPVPESANDAGENNGDLEQARRESAGRPPYSDDEDNTDDRSG
jgi:hypothetical protein